MKIQDIPRLTLSALVVTFILNAEVVHAKLPKKFFLTFKTSTEEALQDPYFQIKSYKMKELTQEESVELNGSDVKYAPKRVLEITNKGFVGPNIPNVPNVPNDPNVPQYPQFPQYPPFPQGPNDTVNNIIMIVNDLIAIGEKIIPAIRQGTPVINNNPMSSISVLPRSEAKDPAVHDMGGWSVPVSKHYKISYTNGFGMEVVSFVYSISFQYNGSLDGRGKYLAGIRASARNIDISYGFDLDASSQLLQISNVGTQQDVIAGATIEMMYTVKNWTKNLSTAESFHVRGDGKLYKLD